MALTPVLHRARDLASPERLTPRPRPASRSTGRRDRIQGSADRV